MKSNFAWAVMSLRGGGVKGGVWARARGAGLHCIRAFDCAGLCTQTSKLVCTHCVDAIEILFNDLRDTWDRSKLMFSLALVPVKAATSSPLSALFHLQRYLN
jgi:hypothetical protein